MYEDALIKTPKQASKIDDDLDLSLKQINEDEECC